MSPLFVNTYLYIVPCSHNILSFLKSYHLFHVCTRFNIVLICLHMLLYIHVRIYTQTKKNCPIFMVLYLSIQLRCRSKNIPKCLSNVRHTKIGNYLILSSYLEELLNLMLIQLFHYHQEVDQQNVTHFTLNGNQERSTMKKTSKNPKMCLLNE